MDTIDEPPSHPIQFISNQILLNAGPQLEYLSFTEISIELTLMLIGLFFSALYSGSEVAFFSLVNQIDQLKPGGGEYGSKDSKILKMLQKPRRLLATILIGNTFANIVSSVLAAVITGKIAAYYGFSEVIVYSVEIIVLTFTILILSEITPKVIAINSPLKVSRRMVGFVYTHFILFKPVAKIIAESTMSLEKTLPKPNNKMTAQDLKTMAEMSEQEGSLKGDEREIIENVIEFGNITVREIMTSRVNIVAVPVNNSLEEVIQLIQEKGLSRMPLFENDLDNISGVIYSKDVLPYINSEMGEQLINWKTIARKALFIPATKKLDDLLRDFQHEKTHIAIVVDEYGGTEGLVTLDDILEEIVGDIGDEYDDQEEKLYTRFKNGVYIFDAKIDLDDLDEILNTSISSDDDEFETLGGLVYHLTERIPNVGERMIYKNLEMTVHSVKNNRVKKLRIKLMPSEKTKTEA
ncbi:hemolysin family protein [Rhodohalobacter sp.]|uniref:hemolysin family protein n=1 Tax=Rhodohalobacter sp. TaxID=1974210 RepID=UPI002ACDA66D|nr:CNNM domain-containing protein [Rhodohalobacter sp.]MDZ7755322.1 CNNM domain-containing protein [Rhodohalobacter sp.]